MQRIVYVWAFVLACLLGGCVAPTVSLGAAVSSVPGQAPSLLPAEAKWKLVWHDEFEGRELDRTKWDFRLHIMQTRHQTFTNAGARVENGLLHLDLIEKDGQYYSPHLQTGRNYLDRPGNAYSKGLT